MTPAGTGSATVIEFFGMPGVGKTSVAEAVGRGASAKGLGMSTRALDIGGARRPRRIFGKLRLIAWLLSVDPAAAREIGAFIAGGVRPRGRRLLTVFVNWLYLVALIRKEAARHPFVLLDQGIAQGLWSTLYRARERGEWSDGVDFVGDVVARTGTGCLIVVHLKGDEQVVWRRVEARSEGYSPLDRGLDDDAFRAALEVTRRVAGVLSRVVEKHPEVAVVECEAADPEAAASRVIELLMSDRLPSGEAAFGITRR